MENPTQVMKMGGEAIGGGCFWSEFWDSWVPLANFAAHEGFRNIALVVAAIVTLVIALRRANIADEDKKTSIKQAQTNEAGLNIDRFQRGATMLGDERLSVRQAGILMLSELAQQNMEDYFDQVQKVLCTLIRDLSKEQLNNSKVKSILDGRFVDKFPSDSQIAIEELSVLNSLQEQVPDDDRTSFNFDGVNFQNANLLGTNLSFASFRWANLRKANLTGTKLQYTEFIHSDLRETNLEMANFRKAQIHKAKFDRASLHKAIFDNAYITESIFREANLWEASCRAATFGGSDFQDANLNNADFSEANLNSTNLANACFMGTILENAHFGMTDLSKVRFLNYEQLRNAQSVHPKYLEAAKLRPNNTFNT